MKRSGLAVVLFALLVPSALVAQEDVRPRRPISIGVSGGAGTLPEVLGRCQNDHGAGYALDAFARVETSPRVDLLARVSRTDPSLLECQENITSSIGEADLVPLRDRGAFASVDVRLGLKPQPNSPLQLIAGVGRAFATEPLWYGTMGVSLRTRGSNRFGADVELRAYKVDRIVYRDAPRALVPVTGDIDWESGVLVRLSWERRIAGL